MAGLSAAVLELGLVGVIVWGLSVRSGDAPKPRSTLVSITPTSRPPPPPAPDPAPERPSAPPAPKAEAAPVTAPRPQVDLPIPRPAAPVAGEGDQDRAGTADAGSGTGGGGEGDGTGGGGTGRLTPPVRIAGSLNDRDYPAELVSSGAAGTVAINFRVRADGRVDRCSVLRSSGHAVLDRLTCQLFEQRFRFRPARDAAGRTVDYMLGTTFTWGVRQRR